MVPIEELRQLFQYDAETGIVYWAIRPKNRKRIGDAVGHLCKSGYLSTRAGGRAYRLHQIIWAIYYGEWPLTDIDHANGDRADNRIANLRMASRSQNLANARAKGNNKKGTSWDSRNGMWRARITVNYKEMWLGYFQTEKEAHAAYMTAAIKHFGEFARAA